MRGRLINVDGVEWRVVVGASEVNARHADGRKLVAKPWEVKGTTWESFERGQDKGTPDGAVLPREIVEWIRRETT